MSVFSKIKLLVTGLQEELAATIGTLYGVIPNNTNADQVVTRALDTGTRVNNAGNIETVVANKARIDYSLGVAKCPNLLVEENATNPVTYSKDFSNAAWSKNNSTIVADSILSPFGTADADFLKEDASTSEHYLNRALPNQNSVFTHSIYAKKGGREWIKLYAFASIPNDFSYTVFANFNLNTGLVGTTQNCNARIIPIGNDWYRCIMTSTTVYPQASTSVGFLVYNEISDNVTNYLGDNVSGIYLWGAQLETGAIATSVILSDAIALTRNADVISKSGIGTLLTGAKGIFVDCYLQGGSFTDSIVYSCLYLTDGTNSNIFQFYRTNNLIGVASSIGNVGVANITSTINTPFRNKRIKLFLHIEENNLKFYVNGALVGVDTSAGIPTLNTIWVGKENSTYWNGLIKAAAVTDELNATDIDQLNQYNSLEEMATEMVYTYEV